MTNGDFIRSMTDEDITENLTPGICDSIVIRSVARPASTVSTVSRTG